MVAWTFAMAHPELTDRLIVLNLPHPRGLLRELATNPQQQKKQPVRPRLSEARRRQEDLDRLPGRLGHGPRGPQGLPRRTEAVVDWKECSTITRRTIRGPERRQGPY